MPDLIKLIIDDREVEAPKGSNVIQAAGMIGTFIPHYCYHPKLPIAGNCRMCLIEIGMPKMKLDRTPEVGPDGKPVIMMIPRPQIACATTVAPGMVVKTNTPTVKQWRDAILEFLLINHPLDCPICDQAGECRLQEFSIEFGQGQSRFVEEKVKKPKRVPLGAKIILDDERCIECSRCIRFMRDIAKQDCLGFVHRGGNTTLTCYPNRPPNTNYDLNIVDICPVGALTSNDFRFRQRVWFLKETKSICTSCATGCNILIGSREGQVLRYTPRDNEAVNQCWMCDEGRLNYKWINRADRLRCPRVLVGSQYFDANWNELTEQLGRRLSDLAKANAGDTITIIGSARASCEELFLLKKLADLLGCKLLDAVPRAGQADDFLVSADKNPNTNGAKLTGIAADPMGANLPKIAEGIKTGKIKTLIVLGEDVTKSGIGEDLLKKLDLLIAFDILPNKTIALAQYQLAGASHAEKFGTFINAKGRLQRFWAGIPSPGSARPEWETLASLIAYMQTGALTPAPEFTKIFAEMSAAIPAFGGISFGAVGDAGVDIVGQASSLSSVATGSGKMPDLRETAK